MSKTKQMVARLKSWRENPLQFAADNFHVELDAWQEDGLRALASPTLIPRRRLAFKACTGPGKTAILAMIGWWRLSCFGSTGEHPKGAALSGEGRDNLRDNLWSELSKWQQRSEFLKSQFTWNKEQIYHIDRPESWFLSARSYPKDADSEAMGRSLSGLHSNFPFALLDETGAMPMAVGQKAEQIFTGGVRDGLIVQAGNPTGSNGLLYYSCVQSSDTKVITITADPDDPKRTPRVDIEHAREMIKKYGRDNPWVMATILGQFPPTAINSLLSTDEVEAAMNRTYRPDQYDFAQKRLGIDVARFGDDRTVIFPRQGLFAGKYHEMRGANTLDVASRVAFEKAAWGSDQEFVDGTGGYGGGVVDSLRQAGHTPFEIHFSGKPIDPSFLNKRAEMWFLMSKWIKESGALFNCPVLRKELCAPTYTFSNGKFQLEPKDQIKKRLGYSPDLADALALTFALPDMPRGDSLQGVRFRSQSKVQSEFDPFDPSRT